MRANPSELRAIYPASWYIGPGEFTSPFPETVAFIQEEQARAFGGDSFMSLLPIWLLLVPERGLQAYDIALLKFSKHFTKAAEHLASCRGHCTHFTHGEIEALSGSGFLSVKQ